VWGRKQTDVKGNVGFFIINLSHDNLVNYFKTNFSLMQHHHYSLTELEMMMPWEREIYVTLLVEWIKEENERRQQESKMR
jgi:hypothetical protein